MNLSRYFMLDELTYSSTAKDEGIDNQPGSREIESLRALCSAVLDPLREALGKPVKVNSGYRGPALNLRLKGATKSQHLIGQAADIQSPGTAVVELFKMVIRLELPFDQIIYEVKGASKWVHVSHNPGANRGEVLLAKFGADGAVSYPRISAQQALDLAEPVTRGMAAAEPGYVETADEPEREAPIARRARRAVPAPAPARAGKAPVAKKSAARKAAVPKKAAPRKPAGVAAGAKKATAARTASDKAATKKAAAKKATTKKAATKKAAAKKATPKPATAKQATRAATKGKKAAAATPGKARGSRR